MHLLHGLHRKLYLKTWLLVNIYLATPSCAVCSTLYDGATDLVCSVAVPDYEFSILRGTNKKPEER